MEVDTLVKFGHSYQVKVISAIVTDKLFLEQIFDILLEDFFEAESSQWIIEKTKDYFNTYKELPTLEVFKKELDEEENELLQIDVVEKLKEVWVHKNDTELKYIKDKFLEFCKNQKIKTAIYESIDDLKNGKYDVIKQKFDDALKAGMSRDIGLNLMKESVDNVFNVLKRDTVKTPWDVINDISQGGLGPGELGIIIGGPGAGKCVGPNTVIDIEYEQYGVELLGEVIWFNPWDIINIGNKDIFVYEFAKLVANYVTPGTGKTT